MFCTHLSHLKMIYPAFFHPLKNTQFEHALLGSLCLPLQNLFHLPKEQPQLSANFSFVISDTVLIEIMISEIQVTVLVSQKNGEYFFYLSRLALGKSLMLCTCARARLRAHLLVYDAKNRAHAVGMRNTISRNHLKVIPQYCIAHPCCARVLRHQRVHMSAYTCKT